MRHIGRKRRIHWSRPGDAHPELTYAQWKRAEDRRLIRYLVLFGLGMIAAAYFGTKARKERLACIAAGGTEIRDSRGQNPYCVPAPDTTPPPDATASPSVLQTRNPQAEPEPRHPPSP
jgi:hypothetical protein